MRHSDDPGRLSFAPAILLQNRDERQRAIETYIQDILDKKGYQKSRKLQEFFEISRVSFVKDLGVKRRLVYPLSWPKAQYFIILLCLTPDDFTWALTG